MNLSEKNHMNYINAFQSDVNRVNGESITDNSALNKNRSELNYIRKYNESTNIQNFDETQESKQKKFELVQKDDVFIIFLKLKRANISHALEFKDVLTDLITNYHANKLIVDLSKITGIDSTFIGTLVYGIKLVNEKNGDLVIVSSYDLMNNSFVLMNLNITFKVFRNVSKAMKYFDQEDKI